MCDTIIATNSATANGITLFGKNSDREPNEAQVIDLIPASDHAPDSLVSCTYIDIPQISHTYAILLSRPYWTWGAEMGSNEFGVTIGNEAVFTKVAHKKEPSLTGMDLLRLGLERASTAKEAVEVITTLLSEFGQGGNCGLTHEFFYHNSFIITDPLETWVLETAGEHWAAKKIHGIYAISNGLTIENSYDLSSPDLINYAIEKKWCKSSEDFNFAKCYSEPIYTHFSDCDGRRSRAIKILKSNEGNLTPIDFMNALRDHGEEDTSYPKGLAKQTICMHAGFGPIRNSQTVGSLVSYLDKDQPTHFFTGTAAPCTSIFKPIWIDSTLPDMGELPTKNVNENSLFWQHEKIHRTVIKNYNSGIKIIKNTRNSLEEKFVNAAITGINKQINLRSAIVTTCFLEAEQEEKKWSALIEEQNHQKSSLPFLIDYAWKKFNKKSNFK